MNQIYDIFMSTTAQSDISDFFHFLTVLMDKIHDFFKSTIPAQFNISDFFRFLTILAIGIVLLSVIGRVIFGKRSSLNHAVSSAIAILCIYGVNIILYSTGLKTDATLSPLPFVRIQGNYLVVFDIFESGFRALCPHLLNLVILAFFMNLLDSWLPKGKTLLGWLFFRILSIALGIWLHSVVNMLLVAILPYSLEQIGPMVVIIILLVALLLGTLKLVVGGFLAISNPLLGLLYAFFFSNLVGKHVSRAILTTAILTGSVYLLNFLDITAIYIASAALVAFIPLMLVVLLLWYIVFHLL